MGPVALGSSCAGERFLLPSPWEPPSVAGKSNQTVKLRGSEESATASLQQAGPEEEGNQVGVVERGAEATAITGWGE